MIQFWCWSSFFSVGSNVSQATRIRGACWNSLPAMMIKTLENWWKIVTYCGSPYTEFAWFFAILQASKGSWFHSPIAHKSFTLKRNHHGSGIWSWKMILLVEARNFHFHCCWRPDLAQDVYLSKFQLWLGRNLEFNSYSCPSTLIHIWWFREIGDPQVTMGFNTKSWPFMTCMIWGYLQFRNPPYIII